MPAIRVHEQRDGAARVQSSAWSIPIDRPAAFFIALGNCEIGIAYWAGCIASSVLPALALTGWCAGHNIIYRVGH